MAFAVKVVAIFPITQRKCCDVGIRNLLLWAYTRSMVLSYAFCNVPVMPLRSEPAHTSEQSSQLLFGERAEVLEINKKNWARIRCVWDDYTGWCNLAQLTLIDQKTNRKETRFISTTHNDQLIFENGSMPLPMGSELIGMKGKKIELLGEIGLYKGKKAEKKSLTFSSDVMKLAAMNMMYAPYQWGGRSIAGIDCSGLSQMAYKMCNVTIPRNASDQAAIGIIVGFLENAVCGDLAFFDDENGKINHVGILLNNQSILHASESSGRVGIDFIDHGGIISKRLKKRTHKLRIVKRIVSL